MDRKVPSSQCDLSDQVSASTKEVMEFACTEEQTSQIDSQELQDAFRHRTDQLRSPIYTVPTEILSYIFQGALEPEDPLEPDALNRTNNLRQVLNLTSVSTHFRDVALGTPELWKKISLTIHERSTNRMTRNFNSLLHHCALYAPYLEIAIDFPNSRGNFITEIIAEIFSSPDVTRKIKALAIMPLWPETLPFLFSLPTLDTLVINNICSPNSTSHLDLGSLSLSHFRMYNLKSISLPSSVEVLHLFEVSEYMDLAFLKRCPNLTELVIDNFFQTRTKRRHLNEIQHADPLTLNHLKRLSGMVFPDIIPIINLQTPTLNFLSFEWCFTSIEVDPAPIVLFCHQVSTTLTTLVLDNFIKTWTSAVFLRLFIALPKLQNLELYARKFEYLSQPIHALSNLWEANSEDTYLPHLKHLTLGHCDRPYQYPSSFPNRFLDLLTNWNIGKTSHFHLDFWFESVVPWDQVWSPQLREELRLILRGRQIEMTHSNKRIEWLFAE